MGFLYSFRVHPKPDFGGEEAGEGSQGGASPWRKNKSTPEQLPRTVFSLSYNVFIYC